MAGRVINHPGEQVVQAEEEEDNDGVGVGMAPSDDMDELADQMGDNLSMDDLSDIEFQGIMYKMSDDNKVYSATDVSTVIGMWEYSGTPPHDNISFHTSEARIKHRAAADAERKFTHKFYEHVVVNYQKKSFTEKDLKDDYADLKKKNILRNLKNHHHRTRTLNLNLMMNQKRFIDHEV